MRANGHRISSNITGKAFKQGAAEIGILLQQNEEKTISQIGNGTIHISFSGIFQFFPLVIILDLFCGVSSADHCKTGDVDGGIKILADTHFCLA